MVDLNSSSNPNNVHEIMRDAQNAAYYKRRATQLAAANVRMTHALVSYALHTGVPQIAMDAIKDVAKELGEDKPDWPYQFVERGWTS